MFIQVVEGKVGDAVGARRELDRWMTELRPGATGFLGSTGGVSGDGRLIFMARFDSADAARANSERTEQGEWWTQLQKCFDGEVTFSDSEDIDVLLGGGSKDAGFLQIMKCDDADPDKVRELDKHFDAVAAAWRPDVIGGARAWTGDRSYVEAIYFTSEAQARAGEQKEPPPELAAHMDLFQEVTANVEFLDISDPWIY